MKRLLLSVTLLCAVQQPAQALGMIFQTGTSEMTCKYLVAQVAKKHTILTYSWMPTVIDPTRGTCLATYN